MNVRWSPLVLWRLNGFFSGGGGWFIKLLLHGPKMFHSRFSCMYNPYSLLRNFCTCILTLPKFMSWKLLSICIFIFSHETALCKFLLDINFAKLMKCTIFAQTNFIILLSILCTQYITNFVFIERSKEGVLKISSSRLKSYFLNVFFLRTF